MQRFKNKYALITGGTSGMGFATARQFIHEGGKAVITGRNAGTVSNAVEKMGTNAFGIVSDAGDMKDVWRLQEQVKQHTGSIDLLFVNAGYGKFAPVELADENHFDELFQVLVKGTFFTVQQILPLMKRFGEPAEIAHAVLFLASQEASYMHGTELTVDAGISVIRS